MNRTNLNSTLRTLFLLSLGSAICALAINGILIPKRFLSGGLTGVAILIHHFVPAMHVSTLYLLFNIPLFVFGYRIVGRRFFGLSIAGMAVFALAVELVDVNVGVKDMMLSAILGGLLNGVGSGLILRSRGSAGGTDILSVILFNKFGLKLGTTFLSFNVLLLSCAAVFYSLDEALFTLVYMFVSSKVIDLVVYGMSQRKAVTIVSERWKEINDSVLANLHRGTTLLASSGGYTHHAMNMIYTVISRRELQHLKEIVLKEDPKAFVVVQDTVEVLGHRIGNQPEW